MKKYDVIVIGSGGGSKITRPAANLGKKVAIIEKGDLGGTCLNRGCIPSKMLIHPADIAQQIKDMAKFDLTIDESPKVEFKKLIDRVTATVVSESKSIKPLYDAHPNVDYYPYEATFLENKVIEVNNEKLSADLIFIVVGARAQIPEIEGLKDTPFMTYSEALRLTSQPNSLGILGGGYIACELAHFYGALGTDIHMFVRSSFLKNEDEEISEAFKEAFIKKYNCYLNTTPSKINHDGKKFTIQYDIPTKKNHTITTDNLLVATGVVPNSDKLNLENTDIITDDYGYIKVNDCLETNAPGVYAFGDVIGRHLFRHTANYEGEYLFDTIFENPRNEKLIYPPIPHAVFSSPQIGGVGYTEQELELEGIPYIAGVNDYKDSAMGMALLSEEGFAKLLFHKDTKKLLGAHIIGEEASNMIHMVIAYMKMEATLDDILDTIFIHPALPEIVRNAARKARGLFKAL